MCEISELTVDVVHAKHVKRWNDDDDRGGDCGGCGDLTIFDHMYELLGLSWVRKGLHSDVVTNV